MAYLADEKWGSYTYTMLSVVDGITWQWDGLYSDMEPERGKRR